MQIGWTYFLHAKFERDQTDYWYRDAQTNRRIRIEGDFKTWELARELARCIKQVFQTRSILSARVSRLEATRLGRERP
jgi:hypothetical protein